MPVLDTKIPCNEKYTFQSYSAAFELQERGISLCYHVQTLFRPVIQKYTLLFPGKFMATVTTNGLNIIRFTHKLFSRPPTNETQT